MGQGPTVMGAQSVSDPKAYPTTMDFSRALRVSNDPDRYFLSQLGRLQYREDWVSSTLQWVASAGTVAIDSTTFLVPSQSAKITSPAGAGNQAVVHKFTTLCADQGFQPTPLVVLEAWFKPFDTNLRDIQMFVRLDDSVLKFEAAMRFYYQQAGVAQMFIQYLNSSGNFITVPNGTYLIPPPTGSVVDPWHHFVMGLNYHQGQYLNYAGMQFDDFSWLPSPPGIPSHPTATSTIRESEIALYVTDDNASATVVNVDEIRFSDLSGLGNIQVPPY